MTDVFISYTRDERPRCVRIAERLQALGLHVWFDANLASGTSFDREIEEKLRSAKAVMVLWSPKSVDSNWVRNEATIGYQRNVLVSVEIASCVLPIIFTNTHTERLNDPKFAEDDPAWLNILGRLATLTAHPALAQYRGRQPTAVRRKARNGGRFLLGGVVVAAALAGGGWAMFLNKAPAPLLPAGGSPSAAATMAVNSAPLPSVASPTSSLAPDSASFASALAGQWAQRAEQCPRHPVGEPVDMTLSTGAWFTVRVENDAIRVSTQGSTFEERILGLQNGWLHTYVDGRDTFYRLNDSGRLLLRSGNSDAVKLEPCI